MSVVRPRVEGDWLLVPAPQAHRPPRLFCFPHAGGDATAFTALAHALAPAAEVWALRMPARGGRRAQPMPARFDLLVRTVAAELGPQLGGCFGFYGQSFGALLAYEVARALPRGWRPQVVIAASAEPPSAWADGKPADHEPDELLRQTGMGDLVADDPDLRELALATIRTDLRVRGSYRYRPGPAIESDLHAVVGDADPMLTPPQLAGWAQHTAGAFGLSVVPGGHLLATVQRPGPVGVLTSILRPRTDPSARGPLWPARSI